MNVTTDPRATPPAHDQQRPSAPLPDEAYYRRGEQARRWGAILLLIGVVWLVFALGSRTPLFGLSFTERTRTMSAQTFAAERVVVTGVGDHVEFVGWGGEGVQVEAVKHGFGWNGEAAEQALDQLEVQVTPRGETLEIEVRRPIGAIIGRTPYADLRITLPEGASAEASVVSGDISVADVRGDLSLGTVSGNLDTSDTSGSLSVRTSSGDLEVRSHRGPLVAASVSGDLRLAGDLVSPSVETVSGDVRLDGATGRAALTSISGDLDLVGARIEALTIESTSGDIEATLGMGPTSSGRISNISGDVQVRLAQAEDLELDVTTTSGEISTDLPDVAAERRSLRGRLGDGEARLTISTTSGDVEVTSD